MEEKDHENEGLVKNLHLVKETLLTKLSNTQEELTTSIKEKEETEDEVQRLTKVCTQQKAELHELQVFKEGLENSVTVNINFFI